MHKFSLFLRDNQVKLGRLFPLPCCPLIFEQETGHRHKYLLTYLFHTCPQRLWKPDDENAAGQDCHDDVCASWDSLVLPLHGKHRRHPGILLQVYLLQALQVCSELNLEHHCKVLSCQMWVRASGLAKESDTAFNQGGHLVLPRWGESQPEQPGQGQQGGQPGVWQGHKQEVGNNLCTI